MFPYTKLEGSRNIAIYGAGMVGKSFWRQIIKNNYYKMVAWFDIKYEEYQNLGIPVLNPLYISEYEFDKIIIAIEDRKVSEAVYKFLVEQGIHVNKIIYL